MVVMGISLLLKGIPELVARGIPELVARGIPKIQDGGHQEFPSY